MSAVLNTLYPVLKCKKTEINSWKMNEYFGGPVRGTLGGGGQYDVMESVAAKDGFEPTFKLTSKSAWGKI